MNEVNANGAGKAAAGPVENGSLTSPEATFDPRTLALSQNFNELVGVKKESLRIPISRPPQQSFFMTHPDPEKRIQVAALEIKEDREIYVIAPALQEELAGEWTPRLLVPSQTRQGGIYLWPIRLPGPDGKIDPWNESAMHILDTFAGKWIRVVSNREVGAYDVISPVSIFPDPAWPESVDTLLAKAFKGRIISDIEHPVIKRLRGLV